VLPRYKDRDQSFRWVPTVEDLRKVENVCHVLEVFNEVTKSIPNLFLPGVWRSKDVLGKCRDENGYIRAMTQKMNLKFEKYWGNAICSWLLVMFCFQDSR
jgi:hypothetical protein